VETVGGRIGAQQMGLTLIHEQFFSGDEAVTVQWPHVRDHEREYELALESARDDDPPFNAQTVNTIFPMKLPSSIASKPSRA
jgi:predicted metal-dependent phosphotriesterase family hydrolase